MSESTKKAASKVKDFTEPAKDSEYYDVLREHNIEFIFYGDHERSLVHFRPERLGYLERIFQNSTVEIYRTQL